MLNILSSKIYDFFALIKYIWLKLFKRWYISESDDPIYIKYSAFGILVIINTLHSGFFENESETNLYRSPKILNPIYDRSGINTLGLHVLFSVLQIFKSNNNFYKPSIKTYFYVSCIQCFQIKINIHIFLKFFVQTIIVG